MSNDNYDPISKDQRGRPGLEMATSQRPPTGRLLQIEVSRFTNSGGITSDRH